MWPGPVSKKFGSTEWWPCAGNNKIAVFPTYEQGAAAQFYLWATKYSNMTLSEAILKWSGHNSSDAYAKFMAKRVPGITMDTFIHQQFLASPTGLEFMKAQAWWEAGMKYPMTDAQWKKGQDLAFAGRVPKTKPVPAPTPEPTPKPEQKPAVKSKTIWSTIIGVLTSVGAAMTDWKVLAVLAGAVLIAFIIWERKGKPDISGWFK